MPTSFYAALNGKEIRDILKGKFNFELDRTPYLKLGNSFHKAVLDYGFTMSAYPADVPVPEKEFQITLESATATSPEAIKQFEKAEQLEEQIKLLERQAGQIEELLIAAKECLSTIKQTFEFTEGHVDGEFPDKARIANDLPVPVVDTKGGKRVETTLPASFFKKEATNVS